MKKEFLASFQLSKTELFHVHYYTLSTNSIPHFSTSADVFNRPKTDYNMCGQCQEEVTKNHMTARRFYKKWDVKHLHDLTQEEYNDMVTDLEKLKSTYNYILKELDRTKRPYHPIISFGDEKALSMMKLPNSRNKAQRYTR